MHEVDVDSDLARALSASDAAFIALHGRDGEDGTVQLVCEALGVPYTGSSPLTCHVCFDKSVAKGLLLKSGIPTPPGYVISAEAVRNMGAGLALRSAADRLGYPIVVKPAAQGSALGFSIVEGPDDLSAAVMGALNYGDRVLLEPFVDGIDLAIAVFGGDLSALAPVEIRTASGVFDFEARVSPGAVDFICPASMADADAMAAQRIALHACEVLGVRDFGRVDLRIGPGGPVVLDVKTCPGLTETSILPLAVGETQHRFADFVATVLDAAQSRSTAART